MKKHLRILYGCDDRFDIVINTAKVCEKHFDSIVIINSGPKEFYERLKNNVSSNIEVKQLEKFLEIESCRRAMIEDVPANEWVLWLDADERPSPELLNNLDDVLKLADEDNYNIIRLIWCEHTEGIRIPVYTPLPKTHEEFINKFSGHYFMPLRLVKKQEGISVASNFGAHELFVLNNEKVMYSPNIVYHMKSHIQYYQSVVFSGFLNPFAHVNCSNLEVLRECLNHPNYIELRNFQKKHKIFTSNDFVQKVKIEKDEEFIKEIKLLFSSFKDIDISGGLGTQHNNVNVTFKYMKDFSEKYGLNVESPHYPCNENCCNYDGIQL